ncbi:hypothetical protein K8T06_05240 [bacterium]|nr:hypothetical protein [bacterium]
MKITRIVLLTVLVSGILVGCIWIDDDNDCYIPSGNAEEVVIYINMTSYIIDNYIDGDLVGSVGPDATLHVYSHYLDGQHMYESICQNCDLTWGPTTFTLRDGETFRIYLEKTGMRFRTDDQ